MTSAAKLIFDKHVDECREAIAMYEHIRINMNYNADYTLRFVWVAAVSALDHYMSQAILEKATRSFANGEQLQPKLLSDAMSFSNALKLKSSNAIEAVLNFRVILNECIKHKSFQHPEKISDGLSYIWGEKHKWQFIANKLSLSSEGLRKIIITIIDRRNTIAHDGDYDEASGNKYPIHKNQAEYVVDLLSKVVKAIDDEIF